MAHAAARANRRQDDDDAPLQAHIIYDGGRSKEVPQSTLTDQQTFAQRADAAASASDSGHVRS
jgi:hypothetical protein